MFTKVMHEGVWYCSHERILGVQGKFIGLGGIQDLQQTLRGLKNMLCSRDLTINLKTTSKVGLEEIGIGSANLP